MPRLPFAFHRFSRMSGRSSFSGAALGLTQGKSLLYRCVVEAMSGDGSFPSRPRQF